MFRKTLRKSFLIFTLLFFTGSLFAGGGMYPLSEINRIEQQLIDAGLNLSAGDIYNPEDTSIVDALVKLGGCTGFFVSDNGLILTNHHCAFRAINNASTTDNNYLEKGFYAAENEEEYPAENYTCRITQSYRDVSGIILESVDGVEDPVERKEQVVKKIKELEKKYSDEDNSVEAQVAEMFEGKTYVLFEYQIIKDVRLVFAPPRSIGEFGGELDNWVWPRHTGDFSFMRAYVAPDGSSAEYSEDNVPYNPKKFLKINKSGVNKGDFVFLLGYPGRTYKNRSSFYLKYQENYLLPYLSDLDEYIIESLILVGEDDPNFALESQSTIKSRANRMKNYRGKLKGLNNLHLVEQKEAEESELQNFIESDPKLKERYGSLLSNLENVYNEWYGIAEANIWFNQIFRYSDILYLTDFLLEYKDQMEMPDEDRKTKYKEENITETLYDLNDKFNDYNESLEAMMLEKLLTDAVNFEETEIKAVDNITTGEDPQGDLGEFIDEELLPTDILDREHFYQLLDKSPEEISDLNSPLIEFVKDLREQEEKIDNQMDEIEGTLDRLRADLIDVKTIWKKSDFIPDANRTLRLTFGEVKGYSPLDAVYYEPQSSVKGIIEKNRTGLEEYETPDKLIELYNQQAFGEYYDKEINGMPVGLLYNTDTSGGNSGSPILDADGNLVGINFDRAYEATINDFAWDDSYSRSIGVDIRYVLWITEKLGGAEKLIKEMKMK